MPDEQRQTIKVSQEVIDNVQFSLDSANRMYITLNRRTDANYFTEAGVIINRTEGVPVEQVIEFDLDGEA